MILIIYIYIFIVLCYSTSDAALESTSNLTQSGSLDLNEISIDSADHNISNMSKKKESHSKDNTVPTYPDGSINYDGTIIVFNFILISIIIKFICFSYL